MTCGLLFPAVLPAGLCLRAMPRSFGCLRLPKVSAPSDRTLSDQNPSTVRTDHWKYFLYHQL